MARPPPQVRKRLKGLVLHDKPAEVAFSARRLLYDIMYDIAMTRSPAREDFDLSWASTCVQALLLFHAEGQRGASLITEACSDLLARAPGAATCGPEGDLVPPPEPPQPQAAQGREPPDQPYYV